MPNDAKRFALPTRPKLRPVESIVVKDARYGKVLLLRDTQGVTSNHARIPPSLVPIVTRFDGSATCAEIARAASREVGSTVPVSLVERVAGELDEALFLNGSRFERARLANERAFAELEVRPASHAGGAYHDDPGRLRTYLDEECLGHARSSKKGSGGRPARGGRRMVGLVAPHIDPWRGAAGYGQAYAALAAALPAEVDTFLLFGTSHAPMREPFALCRKAFATPLGVVPAETSFIDELAAAATFDPYADQFNHKREHSLEFQAVLLKHVLGERPFRIVPVLASLGRHQVDGSDPGLDREVRVFFDGIREAMARRPDRVAVIAGADLAHVGPRFGDPSAHDEAARQHLEAEDRRSLGLAQRLDASAFWQDVADDLDRRRVCGLAPIYSLLQALPGCDASARGELLYYEQNIDTDGSIVSHAGLGFYVG